MTHTSFSHNNMPIDFIKMHGLGNDYIYIDCISRPQPADISHVARILSDRHTGIGGDGVVLILPSDTADFTMRMYNADGSEGAMCGNAIRCVGKYVADNGYTDADCITIETLSGIKHLQLHRKDKKVTAATVDMGNASFSPADIPLSADQPHIDSPVIYPFPDQPRTLRITALSIGNPHCVIPVDNIHNFPLCQYGPTLEHHTLFPDRVNTEIARLLSPTHIAMRVWERGSGETMACGTGACATVAAFARLGLVPFDTDITVTLLGGDLTIRCTSEYRLTMTGPATEVFRGRTSI